MAELTPDTIALFDQLAVKVLITLRQYDPANGDALFITFISRCFLDICHDNQGSRLDALVSLVNSHVDAPVQMSRRVQ